MAKVNSKAQEKASPGGKNPSKVKRWLLILAVLAVIGTGLGFGGIRYYRQWKEDRLISNARKLSAEKRYGEAVLTTRRALQVDPKDLAATRLMAEIADELQSRSAIGWWKQVVELEPASIESRIASAEAAFRYGDTINASAALDGAPEGAERNARFQDVAGRVALSEKKWEAAERNFETAVRLAPENEDYQLRLASARLRSEKPATRDKAHAEIRKLAESQSMRREALRALIQDAALRSDADELLRHLTQLQALPEATFEERLQHLTLLRRIRLSEFTSALTRLQDHASKTPEHIHALGIWMSQNGLSIVALEWIKRLPDEMAKSTPVEMVKSQLHAALGDWNELKALVADSELEQEADGSSPSSRSKKNVPEKRWGDGEFIRLALLARALREQGLEKEAVVHWNEAVKAAMGRTKALSALAETATEWKWEAESTDLLWEISRDQAEARRALSILYRRYIASGNTLGVQRVAARIVALDPTDRVTRNNLAALSLLVSQDPKEGLQISEELHRLEPQNPAYASTYAFALHLHGRTEDAIKLMRNFGEEQLSRPEYAAYFGILLASTGERSEAVRYLTLGAKASLLPEERKLVADAQRRVAQ